MPEYAPTIDFDFKVALFREWLENGGLETLQDVHLIKSIMAVKGTEEGKVDMESTNSSFRAAVNGIYGSNVMQPYLSGEHMTEYKSFIQKQLFFDQIIIDTKEEFDQVFEENIEKQDVLFRGINEARFRLYSSLQRRWLLDELFNKSVDYKTFLENLLINARVENNKLLYQFLEENLIDPDNDLALMSFLQHHGCPTPMLDWTYSFANALYFAISGIAKPTTTREIDRYFSVYFLEEKYLDTANLLGTIEEGLEMETKKFREVITEKRIAKGYTKEQIERELSDEETMLLARFSFGEKLVTHLTKIPQLITQPIAYFSEQHTHQGLRFALNNNLNIITQRGVFTWNADAAKPLEQVGKEVHEAANPESEGYKFSLCYNINKKLESHVRKRIAEKGITEDFLFPDPEKIVNAIFNKTVETD